MDILRKHVLHFEPYFLNTQILTLAGFGNINTDSRWINFLYAIYRCFCFFSITITFLIQTVDVYLLLDDMGQLSQDLCAITVTYIVTIKMYLVSYRTHLMEELQKEFMIFRDSRTHPEEQKIWERASWTIHSMTKAFYLMGTACVIFWISFPALDGTSSRTLPYPWLFPVDYYRSPYYEIIYIFQSLALFSFLIHIVSVDLGYCSHLVLIAAQYEVLRRDIRQFGSTYDTDEDAENEEKVEDAVKTLGRSIKFHNNIFIQLRKLQAIHSDIMFLQMNVTAVMLATVILDTIVNSRSFGPKLVQRVLYALSASFDAFLMCYWGTQLRQKSYDFAEEVYNSPWIQMDVKVRKIMLMIMMKAQKAPKLQNGMLSFELPLLLEIMQYAYNAIALLKNTS